MRLVGNVLVVHGIFLASNCFPSIENIAKRNASACPIACIASCFLRFEHSSVDMVLKIVPGFFASSPKPFDMPSNAEIVHKIRRNNQDIVAVANLHKLSRLIAPLVPEK